MLYNLPTDVLVKQIQDGLVLMVLGMGVVFVFLVLLLFSTKLMSKVCGKIAPFKAVEQPKRVQTAPKAAAPKDAEVAVAIATAYKKHNNE